MYSLSDTFVILGISARICCCSDIMLSTYVKYFGRLQTVHKVKSIEESLYSMDVGLGLVLR